MNVTKIPDTVEAWEDGTLGCDPDHMKPAPIESGQLVDDILGLVTIPVKLPSSLLAFLRGQAEVNDTHVPGLILDILEDYANLLTDGAHLTNKNRG